MSILLKHLSLVKEQAEFHASKALPPAQLSLSFDNFGRIHQTLRVTPAMEAGLADHVWTLEEIVALAEPAPKAELAEAI